MLESVPKCEDFSFKYMFELGKVFALSAAADVEYLIKHKRQKEFQSIDEMKDVYDDDGFKKPTSLNRLDDSVTYFKIRFCRIGVYFSIILMTAFI